MYDEEVLQQLKDEIGGDNPDKYFSQMDKGLRKRIEANLVSTVCVSVSHMPVFSCVCKWRGSLGYVHVYDMVACSY